LLYQKIATADFDIWNLIGKDGSCIIIAPCTTVVVITRNQNCGTWKEQSENTKAVINAVTESISSGI